MPFNQDQVISIVQEVCTLKELNVTVTEAGKGACTIGACAFGGGIIGGPVGMGIGGVIGSIFAAFNAQGKFKSAAQVIMCDMTSDQKAELASSVQHIIQNIDAQDVMLAVSMIMASNNLQTLVINQVRNYMKSEMGMSLL